MGLRGLYAMKGKRYIGISVLFLTTGKLYTVTHHLNKITKVRLFILKIYDSM